MPFVGDALDLLRSKLDLDLVELGHADQLLGFFHTAVDGRVAGSVEHQVAFIVADGDDGGEERVGAGVDEGGEHRPLLHEAAQVVEDVGFSAQQVAGVVFGLQEFELERHGVGGVRGSEDERILSARLGIPALEQYTCLICLFWGKK